MGKEGLEPSVSEDDGFTVRCDANFAISPRKFGTIFERISTFNRSKLRPQY